MSGTPKLVQVSASEDFTVALDSQGNAWAWGSNASGQLGNGTYNDSAIPVPVTMPAGVTFKAIAAGAGGCCRGHVIAVDSTGKLWGWGADDFNDNGTGGATNVPAPNTAVPAGVSFKAVDGAVGAGADAGYAVASDGTPYGWGDNSDGALNFPAGVKFTSIAGGYDYGIGLDPSGNAWGWGVDDGRQLGTGGNGSGPVAMPSGVEFQSISVSHFGDGSGFTQAVSTTGKLYGWGYNGDGELGDGTTTTRSAPMLAQTPAGMTFVAVAAGGHHSLALDSTGKVWSWGDNSQGQLGIGAGPGPPTPQPICTLGSTSTVCTSNVTFDGIAAGDYHSVATTPNGGGSGGGGGGGSGGGGPVGPFYVALGDSYQSGEGAEGSDPQNYHPADGITYEPPTGGDNGCHRSPDAYPRLLERALGVSTGFWACSGAHIADVNGIGGVADRGSQSVQSGEDPQIQHLNSSTRLVTIGIGGNDIGFHDIVQSCVLQTGHADGKCEGKTDELNQLLPKVAQRLYYLYLRIAAAAPNARILVMDYPKVFPDDGKAGAISRGPGAPPRGQCEHFNQEDQLWANDLVNHLDDWIAEAVRESGVARLVDVRNAFQGHDLCSSDPYVNHLWLTLGGAKAESFHPNAEGQAAFFRLILPKAKAVLTDYFNAAEPFVAVGVVPNRPVKIIRQIPQGTSSVTFTSRWPGSTVAMTLVSPSGRRYARSTKRVRHASGPTYETYTITHPQAGLWRVRLYGVRVAKGGERVSLTVSSERPPPTPHVRIEGRPRLAHGILGIRLGCTGARYTCDGEIVMAANHRGRLVALLHTTFATLRGHTTTVPISLTRAGLARLRRDHGAQITVRTYPAVGEQTQPLAQHVLLRI